MPQLQALVTNPEALQIRELEQYVADKADALAPETHSHFFGTLAQSTENILAYALWLAQQKEQLSTTEYRKLLKQYGWKNEDKRYLKVAAAFPEFSPQDLAQIEPATIFQLANNPKKYQPVIDQLLDLPEITQTAVRDLIAAHRSNQEPSTLEPSIWRRTRNGGRYCQIPPIHEQDEQTGVILQRAMDDLGLLPQAVVREAMELWLLYQEGRLVPVEAAAVPKEMPTEVEPEVQQEDLLTGLLDEAIICGTPKESVMPLAACPKGIAIPDLAAEQYSVEELESPEQSCSRSSDSWNFEPEPEKDDDMVEYGNYSKAFSPHDVHSERSPIELLIHTFQTAASWSEISEVLKLHDEYKGNYRKNDVSLGHGRGDLM